jgi:hypothetical protein
MTLRLTEAELARDIHAVLARVREEGPGGDRRTGPPDGCRHQNAARPWPQLSECIPIAKTYEENPGYATFPDPSRHGCSPRAVESARMD